jgi:hypothetical protein
MTKLRSDEPDDRLDRICQAMDATLEAHPELREGDQAVVFLNDGKTAGILGLHGYEDDAAGLLDLVCQVKGLFEANGKTLMIVPSDGTRGVN